MTIKFLSLFNFWSCDTSSFSSFKWRNTLIFFFLTIDVPTEVSRICLNIADQVIYIQIMLLPNVILNFSSQSFKFWSEFLTTRLFCVSMGFVSSANLPSCFGGNPGNRRDRPTSFGWNVFIHRILNKRSNQVKVLLYRTRIWITVEILFLCKFNYIFPHRWQLSKFQQQYHDRWICPVSEYPETDQREMSNKPNIFFFSRVGKCTSRAKPWSFMMSINSCPSDWLNAEPDLLSLSGQSISLKLKSY